MPPPPTWVFLCTYRVPPPQKPFLRGEGGPAKPPKTYAPNQNARNLALHLGELAAKPTERATTWDGVGSGPERPSPSRLMPCHLPPSGGGKATCCWLSACFCCRNDTEQVVLCAANQTLVCLPVAIIPQCKRAGATTSALHTHNLRALPAKKGQSSAKLNCPDGRHIPFHTPRRSPRLYPSVIWVVRLL